MIGKKFVSSNKSLVAIKASLIAFIVVALAVSIVSFLPVFAQHDAIVTITPDIANCDESGFTFTVNVKNDINSIDDIFEVRIYDDSYAETYGILEFYCGPAPEGWQLYNHAIKGSSDYYGYCEYKTQQFGSYVIEPGEDVDFTFDATIYQEACYSKFLVSTLDNKLPTGQHQYYTPEVKIDCIPPTLYKDVIGPQIGPCPPGDGEECWVMNHETDIIIQVYDNETQCDLGLDYCYYSITLDGNLIFEHTFDPGEPSNGIGWVETFDEDSVHELYIKCEDVAGNIVEDSETFRVDSTPPITDKRFDGPQKIDGLVEWIDGVTEVVLDAYDPDPTGYGCNVDGVETYYYNVWAEEFVEQFQLGCDPEYPCQDWDYCQSLLEYAYMIPKWQPYEVPFQKEGESCHVLFYYSVDELGNEEDIQVNCFFVDKRPPVVHKDNGEAIPDSGEKMFMTEDNPQGEFHWITTGMPIIFTCEDQQPHPSGDEKLCFKVSYDYPEWGYITKDYCEGELTEDGYCCVPADPKNPFEFYFNEESMHNLEYYCMDAVEKKSCVHTQYYKVDDTPPKITKTMIGEDHLGDCPPDEKGDVCYVRDDGENGVLITAIDDDSLGCAVDDLFCYYYLFWETSREECDGRPYEDGWCEIGYGEFNHQARVIFTEDSTHELYIYCEDALGNWISDTEYFKVDSTPPETTKTIGDPFVEDWYPKGCVPECVPDKGGPECGWAEWINSSTPITLTAEDNKVGVDKIWYMNIIDLTGESCGNPILNCNPITTLYDVGGEPFPASPYKHADPCCIDSCQEDLCCGLTSPDWEACVEKCAYDECGVDPLWKLYDGTPIQKPEESCHILQYFSVDHLGNIEEMNVNCFFVDNTAPKTGKTVGEPQVFKNDKYYISGQTPITLSCWDIEPHPVDHVSLWYRYRVSDDCENWGDWTEWKDPNGHVVEKTIYFPEDSCHELEYYCEDGLGNPTQVFSEIDIVDNQPPVIEKTILGPKHGDCPPEYEPDGSTHICYIDGESKIHVEAYDTQPHPVGGVICKWDYEVTDGTKTGSGQQGLTPPFDIQFPEESTHKLTIKCEDELHNAVEDVEVFIVDKTPPVTTKWYEGPQYSDGSEYYFQTTIGDQAVNVIVEGENNEVTWTIDFPIDDDTCNGLMAVALIIATDGEGNGPAFQIHNNDGTDSNYNWGTWLHSPWGPTISDGWYGWHSGDTNTPVTDLDWVSATGGRYREGKPDCPEPNPEGIFTITIDKSELGEDFHWALYTAIGSGFCSHAYQQATYPNEFVWNEPIVTSTNYEYVESVKGEYPKWIRSDTKVWLSASDDYGPHDSGVAKTFYRDVYLEDEAHWHYCYEDCYNWKNDPRYSAYNLPTAPEPYNPPPTGGWKQWTEEPFFKSPESCHIIEYYSFDNVGKVEKPKWQCVFVDNTEPTPQKEVGEPKTKWDGQDSYFYPDIAEKCWSHCGESIECWKVTMMTPITLDCIDPDPHPVDHEEVCFMVELDGCDETEKYCELVEGDYDEETGFCCGKNAPYEFKFNEETEHNLKYYCVDALGNSNEEDVDEEKFKVEGTMFEIPLFKKWNLISVPFVLLNDDPEAVFEGVADYVDSVWTHDPDNGICPNEWCVWSPGEAPGNLRIKPGWGYWVLVTGLPEDCDPEEGCFEEPPLWLTIGGSLFSPATTPPSRNLQKGWNLIGYYGSSWELYDWSDFSFVCGDAFNFPDKYIYGDKVYCALNSLIDTQEGYPRWSGVWSYIKCGSHKDAWLGLNACADQSLQQLLDRMYAGRGYWIEMDVEDIYAPATTCIWNSDFECRWTGGGILP